MAGPTSAARVSIASGRASPLLRFCASVSSDNSAMRSVSATIGGPRFPKIQIMNACVPNFPSVAWPASERNRTLPQGGNQLMTVSQSVRSRPPGAARRGVHPALTLTVIAASQLMVVLDATIVNIALPHIQSALHFSTTSLSWVLNAYTLTFGGLLLLGGRAGDVIRLAAGRKGAAGRRRRDRLADRAGADHHQLRGGQGAQPRPWRVRRRVGVRRGDRTAGRRDPHRVAVVALGAVRQRADRHPARAGRAALHHRVGAPARQV